MRGNVWDWYGEYDSKLVTNPRGPDQGTARVIPGGSWGLDARDCHAAYRYGSVPRARLDDLRFRVAAVPSSK